MIIVLQDIYKVVICNLKPKFVKTRNVIVKLRVFTDFFHSIQFPFLATCENVKNLKKS